MFRFREKEKASNEVKNKSAFEQEVLQEYETIESKRGEYIETVKGNFVNPDPKIVELKTDSYDRKTFNKLQKVALLYKENHPRVKRRPGDFFNMTWVLQDAIIQAMLDRFTFFEDFYNFIRDKRLTIKQTKALDDSIAVRDHTTKEGKQMKVVRVLTLVNSEFYKDAKFKVDIKRNYAEKHITGFCRAGIMELVKKTRMGTYYELGFAYGYKDEKTDKLESSIVWLFSRDKKDGLRNFSL